ncbi:hypothetical protein J2W32_004477 [Variovorax boronicumulans]|uniref:Uncharacterized protein n=1 Tax=Variovorax boronicumulans TaxID=436515 RepID=A0AAW8D4F8_9BURK|nr:hypothetical protein [Variovorax boronicumulans]MDP9895379.1 hypothetical protein [Variovorax boronicumulans]MDQ0055419.1 hypothetical protein [Variovorax boronicumulans]
MPQRTVSVGPLLGLNNKLQPYELGAGTRLVPNARYLGAADNVDLTSKGGIKRREGFRLQLAGDVHSLWSDQLGAFAVVDDDLCALAPAGASLAAAVLRAGLPKMPVSYARAANGIVSWSNGLELRCIVDGVDYPMSAAPALAPEVVASAGGALPEGLYIVAFTWSGPQGESAPTHAVQVDVPAGGRIDISDAAGATVWMSGPNGDHVSSYGAVSAIAVLSPGGRVSRTLNTAPMPPGHIVRMHLGSLLVAHENVVFVSVPYASGIYQPSRGYVPFPSKVTVMEPVEGGVYICTDTKTYWITDFFSEAALVPRFPFGAILGSGVSSPEEIKAYWQTPFGLAAGDAGGTVELLQHDALSLPPAAFGASLYRKRDGRSSVVTTRGGVQPIRAAALGWADAEVIRKETSDGL